MKELYEAPRLSTHGDIREITQGQFGFSFVEGFFQKKPDPTS